MENSSEKLKLLAKNLNSVASENGEIIVEQSQRIGVGKGTARNLRQGTHISQTDKEAKGYEIYEKILLGRPVDDSELNDGMIDEIINNVVEDLIDRDVLGGL